MQDQETPPPDCVASQPFSLRSALISFSVWILTILVLLLVEDWPAVADVVFEPPWVFVLAFTQVALGLAALGFCLQAVYRGRGIQRAVLVIPMLILALYAMIAFGGP